MLITITTTLHPATDLGYLLHKNPNRIHEVELSFGKARVFYPEASEARCTAALLLEIDPIELIRGRKRKGGADAVLDQYVNDRPYVASSFVSVAMNKAFGTAMGGRSKERQELADRAIPLEVSIAALPCRGGEGTVRRLFEPLGYRVDVTTHLLDPAFPSWGDSDCLSVRLAAETRLAVLLRHLYVLLPVLDAEKHYWVGEDEVEKLLRKGQDWLAGHPEREYIVNRYLTFRRSLTRAALAQLLNEDQPDPDAEEERRSREESEIEKPIRLNDLRIQGVTKALTERTPRKVIDLGCGEGKLLSELLKVKSLDRVAGMDVSARSLERAAKRLKADRLPQRLRDRIVLLQGSLLYRDERIEGYDAAAVVEVVEHLEPYRLAAFERVLFECARPGRVVLTTPNREYNQVFPSMPAGSLRHRDHRFEWTRNEFQDWAQGVASRNGYTVEFRPIGPEHEEWGPPTQMGVFDR